MTLEFLASGKLIGRPTISNHLYNFVFLGRFHLFYGPRFFSPSFSQRPPPAVLACSRLLLAPPLGRCGHRAGSVDPEIDRLGWGGKGKTLRVLENHGF